MSDGVAAEAIEPAYGRFSRRLKAVFIDWVIMVSLLVAALFAAVSANSDHAGRILGITCIAILLLYEPLLVSLTGSTIGHYRTNLRVVDNRTHGNISFMKAVVRVIIKSMLGIYSFVTMATTSRHQAVHDLLTQSTVQIRDLSNASVRDYVGERTELKHPAMPSAGWRILVIMAYLVIIFIVASVIAGPVLDKTGLVSGACIFLNRCSPGENLILIIIGLGWIGVSLWCIVQGWRGRLFGCRITNARPRATPSAPPATS